MSISQIERDEALYNARDVLSMCRVWPHLVEAMERTDTVDVYEADEQMADLALQMTRVGMPVNSELRQEIGKRLRALRDSAQEQLRVFTEGVNRDTFIEWVANFFAKRARKGEPQAGMLRIGPTRAQAALDDCRAALAEWKAYRKSFDPAQEIQALVVKEANEQIAQLETQLIGLRLDLKAAQFCTDEDDGLPHTADTAFATRVQIRMADFVKVLEKRGVNYAAKVQQCAILRTAAVPLVKLAGKTGLPKIDKEVLESLGRHPAAKYLLQYILTDKTINVYIEGEKREGKGGKSKPVMVTEDGYLHPLWTIHKITGRWGSSPNCQNWSVRAGGGAENLRSMIEAPEGYMLVGADQAQLEARLLGAMSGCKYMCDTFKAGGDIHSAFAAIGFPSTWPLVAEIYEAHAKIFKSADRDAFVRELVDLGYFPDGVPEKLKKCPCVDCSKRNKIRDVTKRLEYGGYYGGAEQTLWESAAKDFSDVTMTQVREFLRRFNAMQPELLAWREQTLKEAIHTGLIRSPILGRMQIFPLRRVDSTVAYNFKAQSGGADIWTLGAIEFCKRWDQAGTDARLINNGHDSVLILTRKELVPQVQQDVLACWNREWNGVSFFMELKTGKRWSDA